MIIRNIWGVDFPLNPVTFKFALDTKTGSMVILFEHHLQWPRDVMMGRIKQRPRYHIVDARYQTEQAQCRDLTTEEQDAVMWLFEQQVRYEVNSIRKALKRETLPHRG